MTKIGEEELIVVLPIPLPTWNRILAMNRWQRKKLRDFLHHAVSISIQYGEDWPTLMEFQEKQRSTDWFMQEYLKMIRPSTSKKSPSRKRGARKKKQS